LGGGVDTTESLAASLGVSGGGDRSSSQAARSDDADAAVKPKSKSRRNASRRGMIPSAWSSAISVAKYCCVSFMARAAYARSVVASTVSSW
jgi:hypothetical protein